MPGANVTPVTIGGRFTNVMPYVLPPVVLAQDGGRIVTGGMVGAGSAVSVNYSNLNDGSATGVSGNWDGLNLTEGLKRGTWASPPFTTYTVNYALGSLEPFLGGSNLFIPGFTQPSPFPGTMAYFDNAWNGGEAGLDSNWVRTSSNWGVVSSNPAPGVLDPGSVKTYPANQFTFAGNTAPAPGTLPAISSFNSIRSYASVDNPGGFPAADYPEIIYEAAWDIYGAAHWDRINPDGTLPISLEVMFWTRNHNQGPFGFTLAETGIDFGDGQLWDLYINATDGGVAQMYSYCVFYLQDAYQEEAGWVDILAGLRYFLSHYVVTTGGAPSDPLDVPLLQITRGWEICSTNYQNLEFRLLDFRLEMT